MSMKITYDELLAFARDRHITSREQLLAYLDHDRLECFICGKEFIQLGSHIKQAHGVTGVEYKRAFFIPKRYGLIGRELKARLREQALEPHRIEECRALGQIYGPSNGGRHEDTAPRYSHQTRVGKQQPKEYTREKPEVLEYSDEPAASSFLECLQEVLTDAVTQGQAKPPVDPTKGYDVYSAQYRLAKIEGLMLVFYTALKEYFRETT